MINKLFENNLNVCPTELKNLREEVKKCRKCMAYWSVSKNKTLHSNLVSQFSDVGKEPVTTNYWSDACFNTPADLLIIGQD